MYLYGALGILALIIIIVLILKKSKTPQENKTAIKKPNCKGKEKHKKPKETQ